MANRIISILTEIVQLFNPPQPAYAPAVASRSILLTANGYTHILEVF